MLNNPFQQEILENYIKERRIRAKLIAEQMATSHFGPNPMKQQQGSQQGGGSRSAPPGGSVAQSLSQTPRPLPTASYYGSNGNPGGIGNI